MPDLVGIWDPALGRTAVQETLRRQLHRVRVGEHPFAEYVATFDGMGAALQDHGIFENGPQPAVSDDGADTLLLDGEIYNGDELRTKYRRRLPERRLSDPQLCLELIRLLGPEAAREFNGLFCIVLLQHSPRRLTIISDRYGFRPLFYVQRNGRVIFGSELKALVAADESPRSIDPAGTLELFIYGSHFHDKTWMDAYTRLLPASVMEIDAEGVRRRSYWTYQYDESAPILDQPSYFTVFATLLDRAVERCMKGSHRIGLFLSGGYDSRSVAASIRKHYLPLPAFTFGSAESRDVRFAAMLAQRLGLEHIALTSREPYLFEHCHAIVWRTEGMLPFSNTTSLRYHSLFKSRMDLILTGFLAEFGGSHTWPALLMARTRKQAVEAIYARFLAARIGPAKQVFTPKFFDAAYEAVQQRFYASFERVPNTHPLNIADAWNVTHLQPRGTYQSPAIDRFLLESRAPHMDAELVNFLLTIPPYARLEQRVYKRMIAYRFPEIRDVPCTNSSQPINPHFAREYAALTLRYLGRKPVEWARQRLSRSEPLGREFRDLNDDFRAEPRLISDILQPMLESGVFPPEMFDVGNIKKIVEEHYQRGGRHEAILARLISWGVAAKYFLHGDLKDVPRGMYVPEGSSIRV